MNWTSRIAVVLCLSTVVLADSGLAEDKSRARLEPTVGEASYYGPGFKGKKTASGDRFNPSENTAAHRTLPLGTEARVTNLENGESTVVEINDRGPQPKNRVIDLSKKAAEDIGMVDDGTAKVKVEPLKTPGAPKGRK